MVKKTNILTTINKPWQKKNTINKSLDKIEIGFIIENNIN